MAGGLTSIHHETGLASAGCFAGAFMHRLFAALCLSLPLAAAQAALPVQLGPRPFFLVEDMVDGPLKQ